MFSEPAVVALAVLCAALSLFAVAITAKHSKARGELRAEIAARAEEKRALEARVSVLESNDSALRSRFSAILDADAEALRIVGGARAEHAELEGRIAQLKADYAEKKLVFDRLVEQVAVFDETVAFAELGIYQPHFDFSDSETFKAAIIEVRDQQKAMVSGKRAVVCRTEWTVDGDKRKGKAMGDRGVKMALRAFNNECDAAIANVRWNNAVAMQKRIETAFEQINKLNEPLTVSIQSTYLALKLRELRLTHEMREKLKAEREERAELARVAREEQRLQRDLEQAEAEEAKFQRLLAQAKAEAERASGDKVQAFSQKIEMLERDLAEARARAERAKAMAEVTRCGYVYVISNVGSFGPDVVKIGLTRRLDPEDRIRELGDASVPFLYDIHAIIYSDDAPTIERALHKEFEASRVNVVNNRREFFRVSLEDVEKALARIAPGASFFKDVEAQEYRETLATRADRLATKEAAKSLDFPTSI